MGKSNVEKLACLLKGLVLAVFIWNLVLRSLCRFAVSAGVVSAVSGPDLAPAADPPLWRG